MLAISSIWDAGLSGKVALVGNIVTTGRLGLIC
jgi:hypothetical protein